MIIKEYELGDTQDLGYGIKFQPLIFKSEPNVVYGYRIYNSMTDENTYVISKDERLVKSFGKDLVNIYRNYDEDTIDRDLDKYYDRVYKANPEVIVTDPNYWTDEEIWVGNERHWLLTDSNDIEYDVIPVGNWSSRF